MSKHIIIRVEKELWPYALKAAEAWLLYHNTPQWDRHKKKLTQRVDGHPVAFMVHETKTGNLVVT